MVLTQPQDADDTERKEGRAVVGLKAKYRSPTVFDFVQNECFNLSRGGMFMATEAPAPIGTLIKFHCDVETPEVGAFRGVGRVVWKRDQSDDPARPTGMAVKFVRLEDDGDLLVARLLQSTAVDPGAGIDSRAEPPAPKQETAARASQAAAATTDGAGNGGPVRDREDLGPAPFAAHWTDNQPGDDASAVPAADSPTHLEATHEPPSETEERAPSQSLPGIDAEDVHAEDESLAAETDAAIDALLDTASGEQAASESGESPAAIALQAVAGPEGELSERGEAHEEHHPESAQQGSVASASEPEAADSGPSTQLADEPEAAPALAEEPTQDEPRSSESQGATESAAWLPDSEQNPEAPESQPSQSDGQPGAERDPLSAALLEDRGADAAGEVAKAPASDTATADVELAADEERAEEQRTPTFGARLGDEPAPQAQAAAAAAGTRADGTAQAAGGRWLIRAVGLLAVLGFGIWMAVGTAGEDSPVATHEALVQEVATSPPPGTQPLQTAPAQRAGGTSNTSPAARGEAAAEVHGARPPRASGTDTAAAKARQPSVAPAKGTAAASEHAAAMKSGAERRPTPGAQARHAAKAHPNAPPRVTLAAAKTKPPARTAANEAPARALAASPAAKPKQPAQAATRKATSKATGKTKPATPLGAKTAPRPAPGRAFERIRFASFPAGATIELDGKPAGKTPALLRLAVGVPVRVRVSAAGHPPETRAVTPRGRHPTEAFNLAGVRYRLNVATLPAGAKIAVRGPTSDVASATSPATITNLDFTRPYKVVATLRGHASRSILVDYRRFRLRQGVMQASVLLRLAKK
ncbi:MAG: PEGA domain-containing protein [Proteobacteria bacterium]|nr:PEGA domain-containing protein [Pseudomonadota bacterium]